MGGLFSSPSPPPPPPAPAPAKDPEEEARKLRLENIERRRRGRAGTVLTSERGLLDEAAPASGKKLLGE
ncbi:hypothetical protein JCM17960_16980 [Magnetospira thiophila]